MAVTYKALKVFRMKGHTYAVNETVDITGLTNVKINQLMRQRFMIPQ